MNATSLSFALATVALVGLTAWVIHWGALRYGNWSPQRRRRLRRIAAVLALVAGVYVYTVDAKLRGKTLFEYSGRWEEGGPMTWTFVVEHPGVEHHLLLHPQVRGWEAAPAPLVLRLQVGREGKSTLIATESLHPLKSQAGRAAGGMTWRDLTYPFTPESQGTHRVQVESLGPHTPSRLHLRIVDPLKRDGRRAPGY